MKIQLNALPAQKHGELKGKLIYVSADTVDKDVDGNSGTLEQGHKLQRMN